MDWKEWIVCDPSILMGKATIKGTRISVVLVLEFLAAGWTYDQLLENYSNISSEDIKAVLSYSASRMANEEVIPVKFCT
jgi:uncharacterized protein (DUF433 family)